MQEIVGDFVHQHILIDEEIEKLRESIRRLCSRRNAFSPISGLPIEILGCIFYHSSYDQRLDDPTMRFNFSFVPQDRRQVAISTPTVWSTLTYGYTTWSRTMLERSKEARLELDMCINRNNPSPSEKRGLTLLQDIFSGHGGRIQQLVFKMHPPYNGSQKLLDSFPASSPLLHTLQIQLLPATDGTQGHIPKLPAHCFADVRLSHLTLVGCGFDWVSSMFQGLTSLTIERAGSRCSGAALLNILRRTPILEALQLVKALPSTEDYPVLARPVVLSQLKVLNLDVDSRMEDLSNLLRHLVVPSTTIVELKCTTTPESEAGLSHLMGSLGIFISSLQMSSRDGSCRVTRLSVKECPSGLRLALRRKLGFGNSPECTVRVPCSSSHFRNFILSSLAANLPLARLKSLWVFVHVDYKVLVKAFGGLKKLKSVAAGKASTLPVLRALSTPIAANAGSPSVAFSKVDELQLRGVEIGPKGNAQITHLQDCFIGRYERGCPLWVVELKFDESTAPSTADVGLVREIVPRVKLSGSTRLLQPLL